MTEIEGSLAQKTCAEMRVIMPKTVISIGDRIELTHVKSEFRSRLSSRIYGSKLLDYDGSRSAKIAMPIDEGKVVPLRIGDEYDLCFFTSAGLYRCRARISNRYREGKMHVLTVEFLSLPKKFQRRMFYRLECMEEIRYRVISEQERILSEFIAGGIENEAQKKAYEEKLKEFTGVWEDAMLTDVSGGGVRIQCKQKVEPDSFVEVVMVLPVKNKKLRLQCTAKVVATVKRGSANEFELRCEFERIEKDDRELIVQYVFEEQKRRMRKE